MINIAVNDKESKVLGFAFYLFGSQEYVFDYDNYETEFEMTNAIRYEGFPAGETNLIRKKE